MSDRHQTICCHYCNRRSGYVRGQMGPGMSPTTLLCKKHRCCERCLVKHLPLLSPHAPCVRECNFGLCPRHGCFTRKEMVRCEGPGNDQECAWDPEFKANWMCTDHRPHLCVHCRAARARPPKIEREPLINELDAVYENWD